MPVPESQTHNVGPLPDPRSQNPWRMMQQTDLTDNMFTTRPHAPEPATPLSVSPSPQCSSPSPMQAQDSIYFCESASSSKDLHCSHAAVSFDNLNLPVLVPDVPIMMEDLGTTVCGKRGREKEEVMFEDADGEVRRVSGVEEEVPELPNTCSSGTEDDEAAQDDDQDHVENIDRKDNESLLDADNEMVMGMETGVANHSFNDDELPELVESSSDGGESDEMPDLLESSVSESDGPPPQLCSSSTSSDEEEPGPRQGLRRGFLQPPSASSTGCHRAGSRAGHTSAFYNSQSTTSQALPMENEDGIGIMIPDMYDELLTQNTESFAVMSPAIFGQEMELNGGLFSMMLWGENGPGPFHQGGGRDRRGGRRSPQVATPHMPPAAIRLPSFSGPSGAVPFLMHRSVWDRSGGGHEEERAPGLEVGTVVALNCCCCTALLLQCNVAELIMICTNPHLPHLPEASHLSFAMNISSHALIWTCLRCLRGQNALHPGLQQMVDRFKRV
jgi:hypothetical protein